MRRSWIVVAAVVMAACGDGAGQTGTAEGAAPATATPAPSVAPTTVPATPNTVDDAPGVAPADTAETSTAVPAPDWLGTRVLPLRPDGLGEIQPTPAELVDRRFVTDDVLAPPATDTYQTTVAPVPAAVVARSTWSEKCPVPLDDLRYLTVPFWGFDGRLHTGELLVHADAVDAAVDGFAVLFERRFPIEEMRVVRVEELDLAPTGDGNNSSAFVCRPSVGSTTWSQHAYGRAIDINPFHNPFVKRDFVIPELASAYVDRDRHRPGMLTAQDVAGFADHGWGWGGTWSSSKDWMHLSANGR